MIIIILTVSCTNTSKYKNYYSDEFEIEKYLGKWYEIVRKENKFEKDLINVTAEYNLLKNGSIEVINKGYNIKKKKNVSVKGIAKEKYDNSKNILKVSFFRPFYSDYIIMDYDKINYSYALVRSKNNEFLWILARAPNMDNEIIDRLLEKAKENGISLDNLIYVEHNN